MNPVPVAIVAIKLFGVWPPMMVLMKLYSYKAGLLMYRIIAIVNISITVAVPPTKRNLKISYKLGYLFISFFNLIHLNTRKSLLLFRG